jgi:RNA polymerase sigma factor (TIGR02999 family)
MSEANEITRLLDAAGNGDRGAWERLVDLVYPDLKRLAHSARKGREGHTLNTTALVHECYLRLSQGRSPPRDRDHLKSLAVRIMRQVLVDHAREQLAQKRGGGEQRVPLDEQAIAEQREFAELIEIDAALRQLAEAEPRQAQVFEHRFFGGLNDEDTASALGISPRTAHRDWDAAREWLAQRLVG